MKRIIFIVVILAAIIPACNAQTCTVTAINPFTGLPDCVTPTAAACAITFSAVTGLTVNAGSTCSQSGPTHNLGKTVTGVCYDNASPNNTIVETAGFPTVDSSGNIVFAWTGSKTGKCIISTLGTGPAGANGTNGNTVLNGNSAPTNGQGNNGDFFLLNPSTTPCLYGPKNSGVWPGSCVNLIGPAGANGSNGTNGTNGNAVWNGTGNPVTGCTGSCASNSQNGDFYIDTANNLLYGPKASGSWPVSGTALVGPQGAAGTNGSNGLSVNWQGSWNSGTTYNLNDAVSYAGSSYISLGGSNLNNIPSSSPSQWGLMAQGGAGSPANPNGSIQTNNAGSFGSISPGTANQVLAVNPGATGFILKQCTIDANGQMICQAAIASNGATPVACPSSSGNFAAFTGTNPWGFCNPSTLTNPLWLMVPNTQPVTPSVMVFNTPTGSGNTTQSAFAFDTLGAAFNISGGGTIGLANTTVNPGTYNCSTITVGADGRITSAVTGSCGGGGVGNPYTTTFTCSSSTTTITQATHLQGTNPSLALYDSGGTPLYTDATLATNGDITITCPLGTLTNVKASISGASGPFQNYSASFSAATSDAVTLDLHGITSANVQVQAWDGNSPANLMLFSDLPSETAQFKVTQIFVASVAAKLILYR